MTEPNTFRVPKKPASVRLQIEGTGEHEVEVFLGELAAHHTGPERPSDLLAGGQKFVAVRHETLGVLLVATESIVFLTSAAALELSPDIVAHEEAAAPFAISKLLEVSLTNGMQLRGTVVYLRSEGARRVLDFLNTTTGSVVLREGDRAHVVPVGRIARVRVLDE